MTRPCFIASLGLASALCSCAYQPTPSSDNLNSFGARNVIRHLCEKQAPAEFECEFQEMTFKELGNWTRIRAEGCGKQATYQYVQPTGWILNTDITATDASGG